MRLAASIVLAAALGVGLVAYGRYEASRAERIEVRGMTSIYNEVRPNLYSAAATTYDPATRVSCSIYSRGGDLLARSVCFTPQRWLIEAVDYETAPPTVYSLLYDPGAARRVRLSVVGFLKADQAPYHLEYFYGS